MAEKNILKLFSQRYSIPQDSSDETMEETSSRKDTRKKYQQSSKLNVNARHSKKKTKLNQMSHHVTGMLIPLPSKSESSSSSIQSQSDDCIIKTLSNERHPVFPIKRSNLSTTKKTYPKHKFHQTPKINKSSPSMKTKLSSSDVVKIQNLNSEKAFKLTLEELKRKLLRYRQNVKSTSENKVSKMKCTEIPTDHMKYKKQAVGTSLGLPHQPSRSTKTSKSPGNINSFYAPLLNSDSSGDSDSNDHIICHPSCQQAEKPHRQSKAQLIPPPPVSMTPVYDTSPHIVCCHYPHVIPFLQSSRPPPSFCNIPSTPPSPPLPNTPSFSTPTYPFYRPSSADYLSHLIKYSSHSPIHSSPLHKVSSRPSSHLDSRVTQPPPPSSLCTQTIRSSLPPAHNSHAPILNGSECGEEERELDQQSKEEMSQNEQACASVQFGTRLGSQERSEKIEEKSSNAVDKCSSIPNFSSSSSLSPPPIPPRLPPHLLPRDPIYYPSSYACPLHGNASLYTPRPDSSGPTVTLKDKSKELQNQEKHDASEESVSKSNESQMENGTIEPSKVPTNQSTSQMSSSPSSQYYLACIIGGSLVSVQG